METGEDGRSWIGRTLGDYRIEQVLATGGMGVVYRARDTRLERDVALKLLREDLAADAEFRARFVSESRAAAALDHANILPLFDAGEIDGVLYLATRLVDGIDLRRLLALEGPLPAERALAIAAQIAAALDYAHARGVVHRDVKPANILLVRGEHGDAEHVYLIDFGISKRVDVDAGLTATGQFIGTAEYVAPEQVAGRDQDGRTDQYALACVLFECVTGAAPFAQGTVVDILHAHLHTPPPAACAVRPELAPALDAALRRALAKQPGERFGSCRELIAGGRGDGGQPRERAATRVLRKPVATRRSPTPPPRPVVEGQRSRRAVVVAGLAVLLLAALAVGAFTLLPSGGDPPARASGSGAEGVTTSERKAPRTQPTTTRVERPAPAATTASRAPEDEPIVEQSRTADWPDGFSGYTTMLASMRRLEGAETIAQRARAAGLDAGILRSDEHADLRPGYWVVFSGAEADAGATETTVADAHAAGFSDAYTRHVEAADPAVPATERETVVHERGAYALRLPASWHSVSRSVPHDGYVESSWEPAGAPSHVTLLVDHTTGFAGSPAEAAHGVRDGFVGGDGYRELAFEPAQLGSLSAWRWEFELDGVRKVDWFLSACRTGYALLGAAPADAFDAYERTFESAARSLLPTC